MVKVVELNDGVVLLRPYNLGDVDILYSAARESQNELWPWMPWCHADYSVEESRKYIEECAVNRGNGTWYDFAIVDAKTGLYIGGCGINHIAPDDGMANLGYWVRTSQTGRGVATRAATLAARFGINELKLNRIEVVVAVPNLASQRIAEKVGATREGIERNRLIVDGRPCDAVMFSIIPTDIKARVD